MTKSDLINSVAAKADISKKDADKYVNTVLDAIVEALAQAIRSSWSALGRSKFASVPSGKAATPAPRRIS